MDTPVKVILVGDSGVGKSCLIIRYCKDVFQPTYFSTIGIDFHHKHILRPNGSVLTIHVYDTAGQERFRTVSKSFYRQAHAIGLVYDNGDLESFQNLTNWLAEVEQICPETKRFILGNKSDMKSVVESAQVSRLAQQADARVFQVSAKNGENVSEAFSYICEEVLKSPLHSPQSLNLHPESSHSYCCAL